MPRSSSTASSAKRGGLDELVRLNALRFTPEGTHVELSLAHELRDGQPYARVDVRDFGPGVPAHALDDIFQPFTRVESARDRASGGVGLGLAITARALRVHGGSVAADNCAGGGLKVSMLMPLVPAPAAVPALAAACVSV